MDWNKFVENWDKFAAGAEKFFNQPIPIIGCSVAALLFLIITILSKTSFGKRMLFKLKTMILDIKFEMETWVKLKNEEIKEIKEFTESEVLKTGAIVSECVKLLDIVCENSHNAKIKEAYSQFKTSTSEIKLNFEEYIAEKVAETHSTELDELKLLVSKLSEKVEKGLETAKNDQKQENEVVVNEETKEN